MRRLGNADVHLGSHNLDLSDGPEYYTQVVETASGSSNMGSSGFATHISSILKIIAVAVILQWSYALLKSVQSKMMENLHANIKAADSLFCAAVHEKRLDHMNDGGRALETRMESAHVSVLSVRTKLMTRLNPLRRVLLTRDIVGIMLEVESIKKEIYVIRGKQ